MNDRRQLRFVRALLPGAEAHRSSSGLYRLKGPSGTFSLDVLSVRKLVSEGVLGLRDDTCFATDAAPGWVRRRLGSSGDFAGQHRQIEKTADGSSINLLEGALLSLSRGKNGRPPFLLPHHVMAAGKIHYLFLRSQMLQRTTMSCDPTRIGGGNSSAACAADLEVSAIDARRKLFGLLKKLPPDCSGAVLDICGFQKGLQLVESERGWPRRSAKLILRIGLDQLAGDLGLSDVATGVALGADRSWMQPGSRPTEF